MADALVGGERRAGEALAAGLTGDAVGADVDFVRTDGVAAGTGARAGHGVGGEKNAAGGFGAEKIAECERGQVNSVGNEAGGEFVAGEEALDDVVVAVELEWATVTDVGGEAGAGADGFVDLGFGGVRVSQRNMDARARQGGDELGAAGPFGGDGDEADATVGGGLEAREFGERRSVHRRGGVGAAVAGLGT